MSDVVLVEIEDGVAVITLNRPEARNALNSELLRAFPQALQQCDDDDRVSAIVLTGADPAFCAGLDLKQLGSEDSQLSGRGEATRATTSAPWPELRKPVIGAINGPAVTGGFELALNCDFLVASERARFADTHARVGIMPGWGLSQKLSRTIGVYRAKELSLSGNFLDARTACEWGLVNRVVEPEELIPAAMKLAADMASIPTDTLCLYKSIIDQGYDLNFSEAMALEHRVSSANNRKVTPEMVEARREAIQARGRTQ
jgi:enoyl-CoA hydratase